VDVADLLVNVVNLTFHPNLMSAAGDLAVAQIDNAVRTGGYILAVDGGIPTEFGGRTCTVWTDQNNHEVTALEAVQTLAPGAAYLLGIGTCASFGGIPSGGPNTTQIKSLAGATGRATINIPGCPTHPDWVVGTIAQLLAGTVPALDSSMRPSSLFSSTVHSRCPRNDGDETSSFGVDGACLRDLGCKGPRTRSDCPSRKWNSGVNWCIGANALCLGCTENGFPDSFAPFYQVSTAAAPPSGGGGTTPPPSGGGTTRPPRPRRRD
jgi:hydrogenase small subunit